MVKANELTEGDVVLVKAVVRKVRGTLRLAFGNDGDGKTISIDDADVMDVIAQMLGRGDVVDVIDAANKNAKPKSGTIRAALDNEEYLVRLDGDGSSITVPSTLLRRRPE